MSEYEPWEVPGFFETKEHQEERMNNAVFCDDCGREMHMVVSYIPGIPDPQYDYFKCEHCDSFKRKDIKMKGKTKTIEELQAENKKLKAEVKRLKKRNARWEDIKWNYEAILDKLSTDEVCEAKHELGLDYEDFDPDYEESESEEPEE